jgi:tetratricopeptide (TPR) repeat protein
VNPYSKPGIFIRLVLLASSFGATCVAQRGQSPALSECTHAFYSGDYARAAQVAEKHLRAYPNDVAVRVMLGRAELAQGDFDRAFDELRKVLAADPRNVDALFYLSWTARELSQKEHQRLFALAPESDRVHQLLGEAALAAEDRTEAEAEFLNALKVNPRSVEVATELAELKRSQSKFDEAIAYYLQAEKNGPPTYGVAYGLGACYTYQQNYAQAIEWLRKAKELAPTSVAARFALGNALFQDGQVETAVPELEAALRLQPKMKQAYFLLGRAYSKLGRQTDAQAAFKKLDELNRAEIPDQKEQSPGANPRTDEP